jgi:hypothetical protein
MAERDYQRLTGARMRRSGFLVAFTTRSSLWLGKDHLLCADSNGYTEVYRRFYFHDLQAFTIVASNRRAIWNWLLGVPMALCLIYWGYHFLSTESTQLGDFIFATGMASAFALPLLINNILGPACKCFVRTAVQVEQLPSLCRLRRTWQVLDRVRPLIVAAQGQLTAEEVERKMGESVGAPPVIGRSSAGLGVQPPQPYQGPFHQALCWLLIADLPLTVASLFLKAGALDAVSMIQLLVTAVFAIVCLARQHDTDLSPGLKRVPWIVLGSSVVFFFLGAVYAAVFFATHPGTTRDDFSPLNNPGMLLLTVASTGTWVVVGVAGLIGLRRFHEMRGGFPETPPAPLSPG